METTLLGIDVGKTSLHVALLHTNAAGQRSFANTATGHHQLVRWIRARGIGQLHACMESTGGWSEKIATALDAAGHFVSVVNPQRIKDFGRSEGLRTKTDKVDAALIARYCGVHKPRAWKPKTPQIQALQALSRRRDALVAMRTMEVNRCKGPQGDESVCESVREHIQYLCGQIKAMEARILVVIESDPGLSKSRILLESIPGIGCRTAATILAEVPNLAEFRDVKAVGAHAGLSPCHSQSGKSVGSSSISRMGSARLRRALYLPSLAAIKFNPIVRAFSVRLLAAGKRRMVVVTASMRKLLIVAYGVLKSGEPFAFGSTA